ncbi:uncharacterized protein LOC121416838 [Lytechinus variegatus]|uniref:uncharacterized protein LOC121416838 n=1 Tax=Lytechinus variegatus TaxID=7654 RepID=UPI001BB1C58C|nr:uncharacterized protein LOC121416838 [Lytechinus variegatus]
MAARFPKGNQVQLRPRKGHDMTWSCDKHGGPIAFYCKKHGLFVCDRCAIKEHCQKPCELDDIEDVIFERRKKLDEKRPEIQELQKQMKALDLKIKTALAFSDTNLQTVNNNIQASYHDKIKSVEEKEDRMIRVINEEADEEIRLVNEKREKRIKDCNTEREKERKIIKDKEAKLLSDAKKITEIVSKKIKDLINTSQHVINTITNIELTITRINQDDEILVNEAPQVLASIDENLSLNVHQDVTDCLHQIENAIQGVKFVEGEVGGEYYGRIDGYIGKWELFKSIHIPLVVNDLEVRYFVSEDEICVQDVDNYNMYITNIYTQHTEKVTDGGEWITSCAPLDSNVIVCGKERWDCTGDRLDGCITLYDRQWKVIRDISISRIGYNKALYVDVDSDGMIIAGQSYQSNIYVINPANDKIVNTITMQGKTVWGVIQALSSGDIVVNTGNNTYTVISRSGEAKAVIHCDEWGSSRCRVDKLTDTLYIAYRDKERNTYAVDQVSSDGIIQARRIVEYVQIDSTDFISPCLVTPFGNLVGCDGDKIHLYKKTFTLEIIKNLNTVCRHRP